MSTNPRLPFSFSIYITIDPLSQGEEQFAKDYFVDGLSVSLNKVPAGPVKTWDSFVDFLISTVLDTFITETVDDTMNSVHQN